MCPCALITPLFVLAPSFVAMVFHLVTAQWLSLIVELE